MAENKAETDVTSTAAKKKVAHKKKPVRGKPSVSIDEIEDALIRTFGNVAAAARVILKDKNIKISRQAICHRIERSARLQKVAEECNEDALDFTENKLMERILYGDMTAIIFYLKCKGKRRGYVERQSVEHSGPDGAPIGFQQVQVYLPEKEELE